MHFISYCFKWCNIKHLKFYQLAIAKQMIASTKPSWRPIFQRHYYYFPILFFYCLCNFLLLSFRLPSGLFGFQLFVPFRVQTFSLLWSLWFPTFSPLQGSNLQFEFPLVSNFESPWSPTFRPPLPIFYHLYALKMHGFSSGRRRRRARRRGLMGRHLSHGRMHSVIELRSS